MGILLIFRFDPHEGVENFQNHFSTSNTLGSNPTSHQGIVEVKYECGTSALPISVLCADETHFLSQKGTQKWSLSFRTPSVTRNLTILNLSLFEAHLMFPSSYCDDDNGELRPTNRYQNSPNDCAQACIKQYPATKYINFQPASRECQCEPSQTCSRRNQYKGADVYKIGLYDPSTFLFHKPSRQNSKNRLMMLSNDQVL